MKGVFEKYLLALRKTPVDEKTEHTDRSALETLLQALADEANPGVSIQHEPKRAGDKGAPDFKVTKGGLILGYVENKAIGENLLKVLSSDQLKKYRSLSDNILLTDYLNWIWIKGPGKPQGARLCEATDVENPKFKLREDRIEAVAQLLSGLPVAATSRKIPTNIGDSRETPPLPPAQSDLFGDAPATPKAYVPDPRHVRNRLSEMLAVMREAERWPWEPVMVTLYRERVFPYLCEKLVDADEAARFRAEIEAEIARLDAAA